MILYLVCYPELYFIRGAIPNDILFGVLPRVMFYLGCYRECYLILSKIQNYIVFGVISRVIFYSEVISRGKFYIEVLPCFIFYIEVPLRVGFRLEMFFQKCNLGVVFLSSVRFR